MRTPAIKIILALFGFMLASTVVSAQSRLDCLARLGNDATKVALDACVNGGSAQISKSNNSSGIDTGTEEASCAEIGFKRKTPAFANCVLELHDRKNSSITSNDPDDATCRRYGFKPKTSEYAQCRLQIDTAKAQAQQQQAQYLEQQRAYQAQLEEQKRQRRVATGLALMQMNNGLSSGGYNAYGTAPTPPNPNRVITFPNGKTLNCTTTGTMTNCL